MNHLFLLPCFSTFNWWPQTSSPFAIKFTHFHFILSQLQYNAKLCLLYTSDAADE